ncbi:MAG: hypothetical protein IPH13_09125, partial [Planctomycetes bacterium]|nr:hypothetical protein [Planctomycetota bacterium]
GSVAAVGGRQDVVLTQSSSMALFADGNTVPETAIPALHLELAVELVERTRDASRTRFAVSSAKLDDSSLGDPSTRHMLEQELKTGSVTGLGGFLTTADGGMTRRTTSNLPDKVSSILRNVQNQMRQSLEQNVVPMPREPIGVGARWTTTRGFDFSGIELRELATWTLTARTESTWSVHGEFEYTALAAAVKLPGMPDDAKLTLRELRGKGSGDYDLDPSLPLPRSSSVQATLDLKADAPMKDKVEPIDATITMRGVLSMREIPRKK